jgi:hypothetical protein
MTAAAIASITVSPKRGNDSSTIIRRLNEQAKVTMVNKLVQSVGAPIHLPLSRLSLKPNRHNHPSQPLGWSLGPSSDSCLSFPRCSSPSPPACQVSMPFLLSFLLDADRVERPRPIFVAASATLVAFSLEASTSAATSFAHGDTHLPHLDLLHEGYMDPFKHAHRHG